MTDALPYELPGAAADIDAAYRQEKRRLLDFIRLRIPRREDAEDLLQDVFFQFAYSYPGLDSLEKASAWLFRAARNRIIDLYRKQRPLPASQLAAAGGEDPVSLMDILPDLSGQPDAEYLRSRIAAALEEALAALPAAQREVFVAHEFEGRSFKELAEASGEPVNTLLARKRYAVLALRARLQALYAELEP
ncbi:MAG: RNA polymerase sigma factor [Bacteroidia bacterium]|nr:RNA polymerase sigma factor [Bacteroidia bacterium]